MSLFGRFKAPLKKLLAMDREFARISEAVQRLLSGLPRPANLLDIGCATGEGTRASAGLFALKPEDIYGIEMAGRYALEAGKYFNVTTLDLEKERFPWGDEYFDLVICNQVLEHLKNIFLTLSEIDRTVKTGGHALIGIPNVSGLHNRLLLMLGRQPLCNAITGPHLRCFAHADFKKFLESNRNFRITALDSASLYPLPYPLVDYLGRKFHGLSAYTFYLLEKVRHAPQDCAWRIDRVGDTYF